MNELTLTELDMGSATPRILKASKPSVDYRGKRQTLLTHRRAHTRGGSGLCVMLRKVVCRDMRAAAQSWPPPSDFNQYGVSETVRREAGPLDELVM